MFRLRHNPALRCVYSPCVRLFRAASGGRRALTAALMLYIFAAALITGCTSAGVNTKEDQAVIQAPLLWPAPPEQSRISYVMSISSPADIGAGRGVFRRIIDVLLGSVPNDIIKPYGISADSGGRIIVADTAFKRVHIYDVKEKDYDYIEKAGDEKFLSPIGVAVDGQDNIYVSDSAAGKVYAFSKKGKLRFAVSGLKKPTGVAVDMDRNLLYVVDTGEHLVKVFDLAGKPLRNVGSWGEGEDQFNFPVDIFVDREGEVFVTDTMNYKIKVFDREGKFIGMFGKQGDGSGDFGRPKGVAVDKDGNIYVVDALFDNVQIFDRKGVFLLSFGAIGNDRGAFWMPCGIYIDKSDKIYVVDAYNRRVQVFEYLGIQG